MTQETKQYICQGCSAFIGTTTKEADDFYDNKCDVCGGHIIKVQYVKTKPAQGLTPTREPKYLADYEKYEIELDADKDPTLRRLSAQVLVGEGLSKDVRYGCSEEDYEYLSSLKRVIVKAYLNKENRKGPRAMSQDNPSLTEYGAGPESTIKLFNLVAQRMLATSDLIYNEDKDAFPRNDNWLNLKRSNIGIGEVEKYYDW